MSGPGAEAAEVVPIETPSLGDRSYVVHDGGVAVVVDPQRDVDRVLDVVDSLGVRVTHVLETHLHNDYVTGGLALAEATGAEYGVPAGDRVSFTRVPVADGQVLETGDLLIVARHTPGHTPNHMAYVVHAGGEPVGVLTGGSMLFGAVGRTDLIGADETESLTRAQFRSVRRLAELPDNVSVHPTHGFGSFCSATETSGDASTIGEERRRNVALVIDDEDRFVTELLAGLSAYPRYYAHMAPRNAEGPAAPDLSDPAVADAEVVRRRLDAGEWVVDLRERRAFARTHVRGVVSIELGDSFATYFGWTLPWQAPVTLIADEIDDLRRARRELCRIGLDELAGAALTPDVASLTAARGSSYAVASFADLAEALRRDEPTVLDVRAPDEWAAGHVRDAVHVPIWELPDRVDEVPDREVWVHCAGGYRASIAASILDRAGRRVVLVDDDWSQVTQLEIPLDRK